MPETPTLAGLVARSAASESLFRTVRRLADSSVSVLIEGESGVGKELVARALHMWGSRSRRRFVVGNCAAIPEALAEAELFGHMAGAFTGALRERRGMFEAADGGTFFLDELGEMPPSLQAKLLRVLEDGEYRRLGDNETRQANVRIVTATNRDMEAEVRDERFREDLYYRLSVVKLRVPPLRERRDEILELALHFLTRAACAGNTGSLRLSDEAAACLLSHDWPGNVRELKNEMERAAALHEGGDEVGFSALSARVRGQSDPAHRAEDGFRFRERITDVERSLICEALDRYEWNKTRVARELGMTRQGLAKKMARFGIPLRRHRSDRGLGVSGGAPGAMWSARI
ncbi:MAG: sigma-54 interaction domain-containing protein [bacterium]